MWIAVLNTRNFEFMAAGQSRSEAEYTIRRAWAEHVRQYEIATAFEEFADSVVYYEMKPGRAYRDDAIIVDEG
jgi:ketosteroid isomerase-like protein